MTTENLLVLKSGMAMQYILSNMPRHMEGLIVATDMFLGQDPDNKDMDIHRAGRGGTWPIGQAEGTTMGMKIANILDTTHATIPQHPPPTTMCHLDQLKMIALNSRRD